MKIVMLGHKVVPSRDGGVEVVVDTLSSNLVKQGHEVTVFNRKRKHDKNNPKIDKYHGYQIEEVFTVNKKSLDAIVYSFFCMLKLRFSKKKYDIIHVHAEGPCFFLWMLGKHKGSRLIVTIHGLDWQRSKWSKLGSWILKKGEKQAVKHADEIIVLTHSAKNYFRNRYHRTVRIIPNGVERAILKPANIINQKWGLSKNSYVLFLARIVPEKGLHYLIEAWNLVRQQMDTDKKLVIAGDESHSKDYYEKIKKMCEGNDSIIMTGFANGELLEELYSNAYLYVLPSDIEGMAMSLLEAISYGNVCLVSDIPENLDIIGEDSFIFEAGNVDRLRHQLKKILRLNLTTHENMRLPFTWEEVTEKTLTVYQDGEKK